MESCQQTVPEAIIAFLESENYEDAVRNAVSLGGDTDTLAAITGSIAEAFYGMSAILRAECRNRVSEEILNVLQDCTEGQLDELANTALKQINDRRYHVEMSAQGVKEILQYGIAFLGKSVSVKAEVRTL